MRENSADWRSDALRFLISVFSIWLLNLRKYHNEARISKRRRGRARHPVRAVQRSTLNAQTQMQTAERPTFDGLRRLFLA